VFTLAGKPCQIFLVIGVTDLRRGFHTLHAMVQHELERNPLDGQLYVFCNRKRDMVKIFFYEGGSAGSNTGAGMWVCAKRLDRGVFQWPERGKQTVEMTTEELRRLLTGIDVLKERKRDAWKRIAFTDRAQPDLQTPRIQQEPQSVTHNYAL
jgi:transposase